MSDLDLIYDLLPDNTQREISEKDLRDSFSILFDNTAKNYYKIVDAQYRNANYVLLGDGSPKAAGDLGKNVANSSLTSVVGAGLTLGANYSVNTQGFYYYLKALPDKSADTNFTRFRVQDSNGQEAYASNIYNALFSSFNMFSAAQSLALSKLLNGGSGSAGEMSVNLISPPLIQNSFDSVEYILLRGANLNLNAVSMGIQILAADKITVVATIPNNQIQLNASGTELIFYYNFFNFPQGQYFLKLISGAKTYITTLDLKIVDNVTPINIACINWDVQYSPGFSAIAGDQANGGSFTFNTQSGISPIPKVNVKSSEIFAQGEDFYLELQFQFSAKNSSMDSNKTYFGLGYSSSVNGATINSLIAMEHSFRYGLNNMSLFNNGADIVGNDGLGNFKPPVSVNVVFIKTGNLFRTIIGSSSVSKTISNNSGYSLFFNMVGRDGTQIIQGQIVKAFKFN